MRRTAHFYHEAAFLALAELLGPCDTETESIRWKWKQKALCRAGLKIGDDVIVMSGFRHLSGTAQNISIGTGTVIGCEARFWSFHKISIGDFSLIGSEVSIVNGGHDMETFEPSAGPTIIGRGSWIGHGAKLVRPVTIGDGVIIKPGSIVTESIPDRAIVCGVPGKIIGENQPHEKTHLWGNRYFNSVTFEAYTPPLS